MTTYQFKFKANRNDSTEKSASVTANNLTEALRLVRMEQGSGIVITNCNSYPNY